MTLTDTDVLIDFLNARGPAVAQVETMIRAGTLRTTAVTRFELLFGASTAKQRDRVVALLALVPALALDDEAADRAALLGRTLDAAGDGIGMADTLIAGIALRHGMPLLTRNRKHFKRVPSLVLADLDA